MWRNRIPKHRFVLKASGYIRIYKPEHPRKNSKGYVFEHIVVLEQKLGRSLNTDEVCHHIDGNPGNNHPSNLEVLTRSQHSSHHGHTFGWGKWNCGMLNKNSKFTDSDIRRIRRLYRFKKWNSKTLAKKFSTAPEYIRAIVTRRVWKHIE